MIIEPIDCYLIYPELEAEYNKVNGYNTRMPMKMTIPENVCINTQFHINYPAIINRADI